MGVFIEYPYPFGIEGVWTEASPGFAAEGFKVSAKLAGAGATDEGEGDQKRSVFCEISMVLRWRVGQVRIVKYDAQLSR